MANQKILLPYNFMDMDKKAVEFAVKTFGSAKDCNITLFHIYTPLPKVETDSSTVMGRLSASMQFLSRQQREKEDSLIEVMANLQDRGFAEEQLAYIFKSRSRPLADEIIDTATGGRFDVVILSCRPYRITRLFIQSVHNKVVTALKDVAVCIVT
ncbi:MAG: universal stress protein [Desulfobacterales bacterium]|nr:universal stress protein [Desulfobacterales bacterium]